MRDALDKGMTAVNAFGAVLAGDVAPIDGYFLFSIAASILAYVAVAVFEKNERRAATPA